MSRTYHAHKATGGRAPYSGKEAAEAYRRRQARQAARLAKTTREEAAQ